MTPTNEANAALPMMPSSTEDHHKDEQRDAKATQLPAIDGRT